MRIHQLSPAIANQIAAGEVIERPASVVKELLENSLDAGANIITIEIGYGGLNQIKISDNGWGIVADDLPLAVAAHATSKISTLNDLYAIDTMGFRGEALASIASVAKLTISSRPAQQEHAMMLRIHGDQNELSPCARTIGTTIDVVDLFFNAPVRKRFLKNEKLEFQAIEMVIKRFALSAPHIALTLKHNNKPVLSLPAALNEQAKHTRMTKIFGSSFIKDAIYLDVEVGAMRLCGWVSGSNCQRSQNDRQWVYINQRMVKDKLINHALKQAYDGLLHPGRFPACLLYFTIQTAEIDVNVHPTKHEVRFQQPRLVHDFFTSQLAKALESNVIKNHETTYDYAPYHTESLINICEPNCYSDVIRETNLHPIKSKNAAYYPESETSWIILNNQYILVLLQQKPYIVDIYALVQQWLLSQLNQATFPLECRPLLVPISCSIPPQLNTNVNELQRYCAQLGVQIELLKEDRLLIRSVPIKAPYLDIRIFFDYLVDLNSFQVDRLIEAICQSQRFDPKQLSTEERMDLNQFLMNIQNQKASQNAIFKAISLEDCRMFLHV